MNFNLVEFLTHPAVLLGSIIGLDLLFGDPIYRWHPVRIIGNVLSWFESKLWAIGLNGKLGGIILVLLLLFSSFLVITSFSLFFSTIHWSLSWLWSVYLGWSFLALRDLLVHAKHVAEAIETENLSEAKRQVGKLVGRDTKLMDLPSCGRATVESLSENFNDSVIAPLFFFCFFGIQGMLFFKVISTLDSMIGYQNKRYEKFGWCSAKFDDLLSFIPSRISWLLLSGTAALFPELSGTNAFKVGWNDHAKLHSSNAGWCEAAAAGALKIRLCGPIWREGKLAHNFWIGRKTDRIGANAGDIVLVSKLALTSSIIVTLILGCLFWLIEFKPFISL